MSYQFSFEKLDVWEKANSLAVEIYKISSEFSESEKYGLQSQIRRASVSVSSNIAEGSSRLSSKSKRNFYQIAFSSLMEVYSQLCIAKELDYIMLDERLVKNVRAASNQLNALYRSVKG